MSRKLTEISVLDEDKDLQDLLAGKRCELVQITLSDHSVWDLRGVQLVNTQEAMDSLEIVDGEDIDVVQITEFDCVQALVGVIDGQAE